MISEITPAKRTAREPVAGEQLAGCAFTGADAFPFVCSRFRRVCGVAALLCVAVLIPSTSASQSMVQAHLPASGGEASAAVRSLLEDYYQTWPHSLSDRPSPFCDADLGQDCKGRDIDGGCRSTRCHSEADRIALVNLLAALAETQPENAIPLVHAVYAAVKFGYFDRAAAFVGQCAAHERLPGWCELAAGYFLQRNARSVDAELSFRRALQALPDSVGCGLEDVSVLLPSDLRAEYGALTCGAA